jgi:hypothetical protein
MTKRNAPADVDVTGINLTCPVLSPGSKGGVDRVSMTDADRPWCVLVAIDAERYAGRVSLPAQPRGKLGVMGGVVHGVSVRQITLPDLNQAIVTALTGEPVPMRTPANYRIRTWIDDLAKVQPVAPPGPFHVVAVPDVMGMQLDPYQRDAVHRAPESGVILDYKVGLGKTITAMALARKMFENRLLGVGTSARRLLVVCPLNAEAVWLDPKMVAWVCDNITNDYTVISADSLHKLSAIAAHPNSVVIFDEAQYFNNWSAERTRAAHRLRWQFTSAILLTGSFLTAGPEAVLSLLDLCCPGASTYGNKWGLGRAFSSTIQKPIPGTKRVANEVVRPTGAMLDLFNAWLSRWVISKAKRSADVMETTVIPDQEVHTVLLGQPYGSIVDEAVACATKILADTQELPSMMEVAHRLAREGVQAKVEWLEEQLEGYDQKVVLFCTYHETLDAVQKWLEDTGRIFVRIDGAITGKHRTMPINGFVGDPTIQFMLAQTDAASVSMNLQVSRVSVMLDATNKAISYEQAMGRTCRRGSTDICHHFNVVSNAFQQMVFRRLALSLDFNAAAAEWQDMRRAIQIQIQGVTP